MTDISGFGTKVILTASVTFPESIEITQFSNDADPVDMASVKIGELQLGVNGDPISWSKAIPLPMVLNVIPGSDDDINLGILFDANRVAQGKLSVQDEITAVVVYADGTTTTRILGKTTDYVPGKSLSSDGKLKTKPYAFAFGNKVGA